MVKFLSKFLVIAIFIFFPIVSFAQVSKIAFTTDTQTISPNTLSGPITIQTQDSNGNSFQTPETIDLEFTSTSSTGEFLGSTGNPVTKTMSVNTANRTFYYRDSTAGTFTISVKATGRSSGQTWNASQQITISSSGTNDNIPSEGSSQNSSSSSQLSAPASGSVTPGYLTSSSQLEISVGGDRFTLPGSPITFQVLIKKNSISNQALDFSWSFGDGNVGEGAFVSHVYKYPGEYAVVVNARAGNMSAVSRLKVKVFEPNISVSDKTDYIEISNYSNSETDLFNWRIENNGKGFIFQPNTRVLPHSSIKFDKSLMKLKGSDNSMGTSLKNYLSQEVAFIAPAQKVNIAEISQKLDDLKKEVSIMQEKAKNLGLVSSSDGSEVKLTDSANPTKLPQSNALQEVVGAENIIYEGPKNESLIFKLTNLIKRVFSRQ